MSWSLSAYGHKDVAEGESYEEHAERLRAAAHEVAKALTAAEVGFSGGSLSGAGVSASLSPVSGEGGGETEAEEG